MHVFVTEMGPRAGKPFLVTMTRDDEKEAASILSQHPPPSRFACRFVTCSVQAISESQAPSASRLALLPCMTLREAWFT